MGSKCTHAGYSGKQTWDVFLEAPLKPAAMGQRRRKWNYAEGEADWPLLHPCTLVNPTGKLWSLNDSSVFKHCLEITSPSCQSKSVGCPRKACPWLRWCSEAEAKLERADGWRLPANRTPRKLGQWDLSGRKIWMSGLIDFYQIAIPMYTPQINMFVCLYSSPTYCVIRLLYLPVWLIRWNTTS